MGEGTKATDVRRENPAQLRTNCGQLRVAGPKGGTGRRPSEDPPGRTPGLQSWSQGSSVNTDHPEAQNIRSGLLARHSI